MGGFRNFEEKVHITQMCIPIKPMFSRHERDGVQITDEPTGSLDSKNGHEIIKLLKKSNREYGQTLILVTHDKNIALQADRIIRISDGMVTQDERQVRQS